MNIPPPPPPIHAFLLTPATNYANVPIAMNTREGQGIHKRVTAPFRDKFDRDRSNMLAFVSNLGERVAAAGWNLTTLSMLTVPILMTGIVRIVNILNEYGTVTMTQLENNAALYVNTVI